MKTVRWLCFLASTIALVACSDDAETENPSSSSSSSAGSGGSSTSSSSSGGGDGGMTAGPGGAGGEGNLGGAGGAPAGGGGPGGGGGEGVGGGGQQGEICSTDADCSEGLVCTCFNDGCHDCGGPMGTCETGCLGG